MLLRHTDDTLEQPSADVEADGTRRLLLKNEMAEVGRLRSFVLSVCREQGTDSDFAKSLYLALEEGVANVINYAYPKGTRGHVALSVRVIDGTMVWQLRDSGVPFDPTQSSEADTTSDLEERPIGGLGIYLMRTIMDTMSYERTADGHNQLTLTKKL
jgi:sigma-B regulation protein RsbU (phosphoserine phosphatase)